MQVQTKDTRSAETLWKEYLASNRENESLRNELICHYQHLIKFSAEKIFRKMATNPETDLDDLISDGTFGLIDALQSYNTEREIKFETYAPLRIRGAILDGMRQRDWTPRLVRNNNSKINAIKTKLLEQGAQPHFLEEKIAYEIGMSLTEFHDFKIQNREVTRGSLDAQVFEGEHRKLDVVDLICDKTITENAEHIKIAEIIQELSKGLNKSERIILILYAVELIPMKEIAEVHLGLSESRISQMYSKMLPTLRMNYSRMTGIDLHDINFEASNNFMVNFDDVLQSFGVDFSNVSDQLSDDELSGLVDEMDL